MLFGVMSLILSSLSYNAGHAAGFSEALLVNSVTNNDLQDTSAVIIKHARSITVTGTNENESYADYLWNGQEIYHQAAKAMALVTDKVTVHTYQIMYGKFLLPFYHQKPSMKMLEIGLGCDMDYGPGASVGVYKKLFPKAELWEAEYDAACVDEHRDGMLKDINILTGDQGNKEVLDGWIKQSGGNFDVVIDDGGHHNCQIWESFLKLWPTVNPGGLYFIEDMQVATLPMYQEFHTATCDENTNVPDKLKGFVDDLIYDTSRESDIKFIFCQSEACVLGKKE